MSKWIGTAFLIVIAGLCPLASFAQSAYGPNESSILDRLVNGYISPATAKTVIAKLVAQRRKNVQIHPKDPVAHYDLGRALKMEASYYFEVGENDKGYSDDLAAISEQQAAIKLKPGYADAYASLGYLQQSLGNDTEALDSYHKAVSLDPNCSIAYVDLGVYASSTYHDDETAMADYRKSVAADPNFAGARYDLGCVLQNQAQKNGSRNDLESAAAEFRAALKLWPFFQSDDTNLILAVQALGDTDQEIKLEQEAIARNPNEPGVYVSLANLYVADNKPDQAIPLYRKATQIDLDCSRAYQDLADILVEDPATVHEAEMDFRVLIRVDPKESDGYAGLSYAMYKEGHLDDAIAELQETIAVGQSPKTMGGSGHVLTEKEQYDEILTLVNEAIGVDPFSGLNHVYLGEVLYHQGKQDDARQEWQKVFSLGDSAAAIAAQKELDADKAASATPPAATSTPTPPTQGAPSKTP